MYCQELQRGALDDSLIPSLSPVPARWKLLPVDQSAVEGQTVSFHCQVGGVPAPAVTWTVKSGTNLLFLKMRYF